MDTTPDSLEAGTRIRFRQAGGRRTFLYEVDARSASPGLAWVSRVKVSTVDRIGTYYGRSQLVPISCMYGLTVVA